MKLHEHRQARMNLIGRYGPGAIEVNGRTFTAPLILAPGFVHENWIANSSALDAGSLAPIWELQARIVLLGAASPVSTTTLRELRALLAARQVALESMDLGAACRTYNVLAQEDRAVAALLFP
jgi:uncharacterized protein